MMKLKRTQDLTSQGEGICVAAVSEAKEETGVSKPGYGSSVACCGEGKYSLLLLVSIVCLPSSYFDALKFCFCVDGFIWSRLLVLMLGYQNGISGPEERLAVAPHPHLTTTLSPATLLTRTSMRCYA
ncbi:hypothetical protein P8452_66718 [Trifolium repens]|nr:hypothetical protein P8452_66718 [Trifolium repens]